MKRDGYHLHFTDEETEARELGILLTQGLTARKHYHLGLNPASLVPGGRGESAQLGRAGRKSLPPRPVQLAPKCEEVKRDLGCGRPCLGATKGP